MTIPSIHQKFLGAHWLCVGLATLVCFQTLGPAAEDTSGATTPNERDPVRVLVVYYSRSGNTEKMAKAVAEGVRQAGGVPQLKEISQATKEELEMAQGIVLGAPTYFANLPGEMKSVMDTWNWKLKVDFTDKAGGAFASGGGQAGGQANVIVSLLLFMIHNRMVVAGPLYTNETTGSVWAESGAAAITGPLDPGVSEAELGAARRLGDRVARLARKLGSNR